MTECKRLVKEGFIQESFFKTETICDFKIDEGRKKVWAIALNLLIVFDTVCKRHNLKYFLYCGSLLGAVRHKGFVPWDDDIDVGMPRKDFSKLLTLGNEFAYPYFLQSHETDSEYFYSYAKVRNSNTTAISKPFRYQKYNHGAFLDIFPFDNCSFEDLEERSLRIKDKIIDLSNYMRMSNPYLTAEDRERVSKYSGKNPNETMNEILADANKYNDIDSEYVSPYCFSLYDCKKQTFRKDVLFETIEWEFEGFKVPIPKQYDLVLSQLYGNYMQFPPIEKRGLWHNDSVFDMDIPYIDMLNKIYEEDKNN